MPIKRLFACSVAKVMLLLTATVVFAHDQVPGAKQQRPIAIVGATIHAVDQPVIAGGTLLFEDGIITAVGKKVDLPPGTRVIQAEGQHLYPGLIEAMSDIGLREITAVEATVDSQERGNVNPNVQALAAINPDSELIPVARAGGVLIAMAAPQGGWLRGQTSVIQLDGWTVPEMELRSPAGNFVSWPAMFPSGKNAGERADRHEQKIRELDEWLARARHYAAARLAAPQQTATDLRLDSLVPVIEGKLPWIVEANLQRQIESAIVFAQRQGLRLIIYGGYDAEQCASLLRKYDVPVIIGAIYRLPLRRHDAYDAPYTLPARLRDVGVRFAIAGEGAGYPGGASNARNLPYHAATAVPFGLTREEALRAISLSAAEILNVDSLVGSLTLGKHATLFLATGDILETESNVTQAFIQGREVDLRSRHTQLYRKYLQKPRQ